MIGNTGRKWGLWPDNDKSDRVFFRECGNGDAIENIEFGAFSDLGDPGIARRHYEAVAFGVLQRCPRQTVFSPAAAKDKDIHCRVPCGYRGGG